MKTIEEKIDNIVSELVGMLGNGVMSHNVQGQIKKNLFKYFKEENINLPEPPQNVLVKETDDKPRKKA